MTTDTTIGNVYEWATERDRATRLFGGDTPGPTLEAGLIDIFQQNPAAVARAIDRVAERWTRGDIRSPWAVLRVEAAKAVTPAQLVTAHDNTNRAQAEARTEQWIRTTGIHIDREDELLLELFGNGGRLHTWAQIDLVDQRAPGARQPDWRPGPARGDQALVTRMLASWRTHRPNGLDVDHAEHKRAHKWQADRHAARDNARPHPAPEPDLEPEHTRPIAASATVQDGSQ